MSKLLPVVYLGRSDDMYIKIVVIIIALAFHGTVYYSVKWI